LVTTRIDFETHYYPREYIDLLKARSSNPRFFLDAEGRIHLAYNDIVTIPRFRLIPKFTDSEERMNDMRAMGIERQVVSIPLPGCDLLPSEEATRVCRAANDGLAEVCEKHPDHFTGLALIPVQDVEGMKEEFRRAVNELGLKGVHVHSNTFGKMLDAPEYQAVFEMANRLDVPVFIHPTVPFELANSGEYRIASTFGLQVDLSMSLLRMIFCGTLERLQGLNLVVSHLGSTLPYISNRIDDEFDTARGKETRIEKHPSEYMKKLNVDTVTRHIAPLEFAIQFYGEDKIVFGSDYPFWNSQEHISAIEESSLGDEGKEKVFSMNATRLLKL
jgi:predicted TIM-barrel fold metal-dependent hydrolase